MCSNHSTNGANGGWDAGGDRGQTGGGCATQGCLELCVAVALWWVSLPVGGGEVYDVCDVHHVLGMPIYLCRTTGYFAIFDPSPRLHCRSVCRSSVYLGNKAGDGVI